MKNVIRKWFKETRPGADRLYLSKRTSPTLFIGQLPLVALSAVPGLRGRLPEPFDVPNHAINFSLSATAGALYGYIIGRGYARLRPEASAGELQRAAAGVGFALMAAANVAFETRTGVRLLHESSMAGTPDSVDIAYGISGAAIGTTAAIRCRHIPTGVSAEEPPGELDDV